MKEIELETISIADVSRLEMVVANVASKHDLFPALKCSLAKYPGCVHWHFKRQREKGTIEMTFWPAGRRFWFKMQAGRTGVWMKKIVPLMKTEIETQINSCPPH
jgi:hypothetical protein